MKLLYIHTTSPKKEKANIIQVIQMCDDFKKKGIEVSLALPGFKNKDETDYKEIIEEKIGKTIRFNLIIYKSYSYFNGRGDTYLNSFGAYRILKKNDFDLCFTRSMPINWMAISLGMQTIFESHNSSLSNNKIANKFLVKKIISLSKKSNQILFISISKTLNSYWIEKGIPSKKTIALHDSVAIDEFRYIPNINDAKKEIDIPSNKKNIVYTGSLYENRGIETIIRLAQEIPNALFTLAGGPQKQKKYYEKIASERKINNVKFFGHLPYSKVKKVLFSADVLLMIWSWKVPTIKYCSPLKVFEYMAAGRIIVGHRFPTIEEVLDDNEALLSDPNSHEKLKENLRYALTLDYPNKYAENSRFKVENNFTWDKRVSNILERINGSDKK